jgi:hypothetical protein
MDSGGLEELPQDANEPHGPKAWNGTYRNVLDYFKTHLLWYLSMIVLISGHCTVLKEMHEKQKKSEEVVTLQPPPAGGATRLRTVPAQGWLEGTNVGPRCLAPRWRATGWTDVRNANFNMYWQTVLC